MLYITAFSNYEEFQELFGVRQFDNGNKARKNKILLALLKDKVFFKEAVKSGDLYPFSIKNMVNLRNYLTHRITVSGAKSKKLRHKIWLLDRYYYSNKYTLDDMAGVCEDGTPNAVRYVNMENNRPWKMKAGKFYKHLIESTAFGKKLNQTLVIWLCEEFSRDWQSHVIGQLPKNKLYVNDNFADIYDSKRLKGYKQNSDAFISCMVDKGLHSFYRNAVKAKASYLEDESGMIIARCVIFTDVYDETGKKWRYAERQYSVGCNDIYKQALVDALIQAGEIDCYKKVGASCHDCHAIVDINGNSLADKEFWIDCDLDWDDDLSYQDTFKSYSMSRRRAYNDEDASEYDLAITEGSLANADNDNDEPQEYDSYHDRDAWEVCTCYYHGDEETVDVEDREEFELFKGHWYYKDDIVTCPVCGERMLDPEYYDEDDGVYESDVTDQAYCCEECREKAELAYKKEHWHYSDYDDDYYYDNDITTYQKYNCLTGEYEEKTISKDSFYDLVDHGELHEWGGAYFDVVNEEVDKPYGYETLLEFTIAA